MEQTHFQQQHHNRQFEANSKLLLTEVFKAAGQNFNVPELDGVPCVSCGKVPEVKVIQRASKNGNPVTEKDRSARVDCDASEGELPTQLETYCHICWEQKIRGE